MSAERSSRDHRLLAQALGQLTRGLLHIGRPTLITAVLIAVICLLLTAFGLRFRTKRLDLLNPQSAYNQRWLSYLDEFGGEDDAVIIVQGADRAAVTQSIDRVAASLSRHPDSFHAVLSKIDVEAIRTKALHFLSAEELQSVRQGIARLSPVLGGDWTRLELVTMLQDWNRNIAQLRRRQPDPRTDAELQHSTRLMRQLLKGLTEELQDRPVGSLQLVPSPLQESEGRLHRFTSNGSGHVLFDRGRTGLILARLTNAEGDAFAHGTESINRMREVLAAERSAHPEMTIGLTGLPILENDEMRTSQQDMVVAGLVSLVGVAGLFVAGFGGVRLPILTVAALLIAMAWSFGYVTLAVGHLNILSVSFGVILIGLGIDFGIHYVARYTQLRSAGSPSDDAIIKTSSSVGPGIMTGGITTALAFYSAALTEFTGVAELGIIAGGGILFCIVAALTVLPVMIRLTEPRGASWRAPRPLPFAALCIPVSWAPRLFLVLMIVATLVLGVGISKLTFDHNLLHLQAKGLESVVWEHRLLESGDHSVWFAVSVAANQAEIQDKKRRFEQLDCVQRTEEISSLLPAPDRTRSAVIAQIRMQLSRLPKGVPLLPISPRSDLLQALRETHALVSTAPQSSSNMTPLIDDVWTGLSAANWGECSRKISRFQQRLAGEVLRQLQTLHAMADPVAPIADDLPEALVTRFVGRTGKQLLRVYAEGDIWDMEALSRFVRDVEAVDPDITGHPIQTYYSSRQMQASYVHAAVYSFLAVAVVLMLDFRSVRLTLLAMLPMACGMAQMFGLLGWFGIPLNPANLIVLPLILGIGIDDGVHVAHDYLRSDARYRVGMSTAAAVVLTSATTMVGFGSMMIARHQGLRSLGQVLTLGVCCCLITSLVMLPAILALWPRSGNDSTAENAVAEHDATLQTPRRR